MRVTRRRNVLLLSVLASLALTGLAAPAASSAAIVGIGDQKPEVFTAPLFRDLDVEKTRYFTPWNSIFTEPQRLKAWVDASRAAGLEPLIAFEKARTMKCPSRSCRPPSVRSYTRAFKAFRKAYPRIRLIQPWNEVNSPTQPTGKNPRRAAEFYNVVKANCRRCTVPAADIQDLSPRTMARYLKTFRRYAKGNRLGNSELSVKEIDLARTDATVSFTVSGRGLGSLLLRKVEGRWRGEAVVGRDYVPK